MKLATILLPLVALTNAFVVPDEQMTQALIHESQGTSKTWLDRLSSVKNNLFSHVEETLAGAVALGENAIDNALKAGSDAKNVFECHASMTKFAVQDWLDSAMSKVEDVDTFDEHKGHHPKKPHSPHKRPHHKPPTKTVYELIASSKYTTTLAKDINEFPDLVDFLNGTTANFTVFAPTNEAFEKLHRHFGDHKPSKELIKKIITYHVSPDFYPAGRVLITHTIPTALNEDALGGNPQRLRIGLGLKGLAVNWYSRVVAVDIFGTNGVIHGVDSVLFPPPPALKIVSLLPTEFSTLLLAIEKTKLESEIESHAHTGGTLFAPNNWAFAKLGPKANAFLFSKYGLKHLRWLLEYHAVANQTLYSDAFYGAKSIGDEVDAEAFPKGRFHVDLPTLLKGKSLSIDVARYGGLISIKINGFNSVSVQDGIAHDGVIHTVSSVLLPPRTKANGEVEHWDGEELTVEDLKERLQQWGENEKEDL